MGSIRGVRKKEIGEAEKMKRDRGVDKEESEIAWGD